jgi:hypothetical protein
MVAVDDGDGPDATVVVPAFDVDHGADAEVAVMVEVDGPAGHDRWAGRRVLVAPLAGFETAT